MRDEEPDVFLTFKGKMKPQSCHRYGSSSQMLENTCLSNKIQREEKLLQAKVNFSFTNFLFSHLV